MTDERQNFRLTVIEKKLDIPTATNPLAGVRPEQGSASEQDKRLIESLLQLDTTAVFARCWLAGSWFTKDRAKRKALANRGWIRPCGRMGQQATVRKKGKRVALL